MPVDARHTHDTVEGPHPWPAQSAPPASRVGSCLKAELWWTAPPARGGHPLCLGFGLETGLRVGGTGPERCGVRTGSTEHIGGVCGETGLPLPTLPPSTHTARSARLPPPGRLQGLSIAQMGLAQQNRFSWDTPRGESTGSDTGRRPGAWQCQGASGLSGVLRRHPAVGEQSPSLQMQESPSRTGCLPAPWVPPGLRPSPEPPGGCTAQLQPGDGPHGDETRAGEGASSPIYTQQFPKSIQGSTSAGPLSPALEAPASTERSAGGMAGPSLLASSSLPVSARPPPQEAH